VIVEDSEEDGDTIDGQNIFRKRVEAGRGSGNELSPPHHNQKSTIEKNKGAKEGGNIMTFMNNKPPQGNNVTAQTIANKKRMKRNSQLEDHGHPTFNHPLLSQAKSGDTGGDYLIDQDGANVVGGPASLGAMGAIISGGAVEKASPCISKKKRGAAGM
jgi:hypothetical protein